MTARRSLRLRSLVLAGLVATCASSARAGISLDMDFAAPASMDVVLRFEAEGSGPFTLRTWEIHGSDRVAEALQADPDGDVAMTGLPSGALTLPGEAMLPSGIELRAYQLVDEGDGSCSNLGYVARRRQLFAEAATVLAIPERSSLRTLSAVLDRYPAVGRVEIIEPSSCRRSAIERVPGGRRGVDAFIPLGKAVQVTLSRDSDLVIVGASGSRHDGTRVDLRDADCPNGVPLIEFISSPFGVDWPGSVDLVCGREGVDWIDANEDGRPDSCPSGLFDGTNLISVTLSPRHAGDRFLSSVASVRLGMRNITGRFELDPVAGWAVGGGQRGRNPPSVNLATQDAGAAAACRCADTDGDGDDDCTERLMGTDPADPSSRGPDTDRDGLRDGDDDCPAAADPLQRDGDGDGYGDACDPDPTDPANEVVDPDRDGILDGVDRCPDLYDPLQRDEDFDGVGTACDNCPDVANTQADGDADGAGDECDTCPLDPRPDVDADGACGNDNCPHVSNSDQADYDLDSFGDACDCWSSDDRLPEVPGLRIAAIGGSALILRRLSWQDDRAALPGFPDDKVFDIKGGLLETLHSTRSLRTSECVRSAVREAVFIEGPAAGSRWYLVRMRAACAEGSLGVAGPPGGPNPRDEIDPHAGWYCP